MEMSRATSNRLPPLREVGEGWGGVKPFTLAASSCNPSPALPCVQGREQISFEAIQGASTWTS